MSKAVEALEKHMAELEARFAAQKLTLVPSARTWRDGYMTGLKEALRIVKNEVA